MTLIKLPLTPPTRVIYMITCHTSKHSGDSRLLSRGLSVLVLLGPIFSRFSILFLFIQSWEQSPKPKAWRPKPVYRRYDFGLWDFDFRSLSLHTFGRRPQPIFFGSSRRLGSLAKKPREVAWRKRLVLPLPLSNFVVISLVCYLNAILLNKFIRNNLTNVWNGNYSIQYEISLDNNGHCVCVLDRTLFKMCCIVNPIYLGAFVLFNNFGDFAQCYKKWNILDFWSRW